MKGDRAGLVKVEHERPAVKSCRTPEGSFQISTEGDVFICCCDYFGKHIMGNIKDNSILEIWRNPRFADIRTQARNGIAATDMCSKCILRKETK
jgi:radical SAM protein with 4Fe4S-binding SPASM domain